MNSTGELLNARRMEGHFGTRNVADMSKQQLKNP